MQPPPKPQFQAGVPIQQMSGVDLQAQAIGQAGRAVGQTGDLALALVEEQDRQDMADAELIMRRESERLATDLAQNFNPAKHPEIAKERFDSAITKVLQGRDLRPAMEANLKSRLEMFASAKIEKISRDAQLMQIQNGKKLHLARVDAAKASGDYDGARALMKEGAGHYYSNELAEMGVMNIDREEKIDGFEVEAANGNERLFESKNLGISDADRKAFKRKAEYSKRRLGSEEMGRIDGRIATGDIRTKEDLESALDRTQHVDDSTKAKALKSWASATPLSLKEKKSLMSEMDQAYDWYAKGEIGKDEYLALHHQITQKVLAHGNRPGSGGIRARLYSLDPTKWRNGVPDSATRKKLTARSFVKDFAQAGGLGVVPDELKDNPAKAFRAKGEIEDFEEEVTRQVDKWLETEEGQNATDEQIREKVIKVTSDLSTGAALDQAQGLNYIEAANKIIGAGNSILPKN